MFVDTLKGMTSIFDSRFLMYVFFPCLVFWGLLLVVWLAGTEGVSEAARRWRGQEGVYQAAEAVCFVLAVYIFSIMLVGKMHAILQFYEGYWTFPGSRYLKEYGKARHQRILKKLSRAPHGYDTIYYNYPMPTRRYLEEVMPTRLGNILKNAELYPTDRYQIDAVQVWPRLYGLLPENLVQAMDLSRGGMEHMLLLSSLFAAFALAAGGYLLVVKGEWWLFLLCFWGGLVVAWAAYGSALGNAQLYGVQFKAAFDLYRNELLRKLRKPLPATQIEEKQTWQEVCQFLYRDYPQRSASWIYVDPEASKGRIC
jgi:hypothetical protein